MSKTIKLNFKEESHQAIKEHAKNANISINAYCKYIIETEVYTYSP